MNDETWTNRLNIVITSSQPINSYHTNTIKNKKRIIWVRKYNPLLKTFLIPAIYDEPWRLSERVH